MTLALSWRARAPHSDAGASHDRAGTRFDVLWASDSPSSAPNPGVGSGRTRGVASDTGGSRWDSPFRPTGWVDGTTAAELVANGGVQTTSHHTVPVRPACRPAVVDPIGVGASVDGDAVGAGGLTCHRLPRDRPCRGEDPPSPVSPRAVPREPSTGGCCRSLSVRPRGHDPRAVVAGLEALDVDDVGATLRTGIDAG